MRLAGKAFGAVVTVAALGALLLPTAVQAEGRNCVGAPGAGDSYFPEDGNGGYEVRHYGLDLTYDPATDLLGGTATIEARTGRRLCRFDLDLVGLEVNAVRVNGKTATWRRDGQELVISPSRTLDRHADFRVVVRYGGVPVQLSDPLTHLPSGFQTTSDGVSVTTEPEGADTWYPANDHPTDKASFSFEVTVPPGYQVVANGEPRGHRKSPNGWTAWRWESRQPMASYLATIDVGKWDVHRWRTGTGVPVYDAVDPAIPDQFRQEIDSSLARQGEILKLLGHDFGHPYPFSTVGGIVDHERPIGYALENQTRPVYSYIFWIDNHGQPTNADYVIAHELSHQWFGDYITLRRWRDTWLNEGFATYVEWLWSQHEGQGTPEQMFQGLLATPADDPLWSLVIGNPGPVRAFDDPVYVRGAMTLQALRDRIGDRSFWKLIRRWVSTRGGGHGTTGQFISLAESVSGKQLDSLFRTWLFTDGKPAQAARASTEIGASTRSQASAWLKSVRSRLRKGAY